MQSSAAPAALESDHDGADGASVVPREESGPGLLAEPPISAARSDRGRGRLRLVRAGEAGTTTAEYTVVTAAAVAFGALLLKLLTGGWGTKILETAFRGVIKMLGF